MLLVSRQPCWNESVLFLFKEHVSPFEPKSTDERNGTETIMF